MPVQTRQRRRSKRLMAKSSKLTLRNVEKPRTKQRKPPTVNKKRVKQQMLEKSLCEFTSKKDQFRYLWDYFGTNKSEDKDLAAILDEYKHNTGKLLLRFAYTYGKTILDYYLYYEFVTHAATLHGLGLVDSEVIRRAVAIVQQQFLARTVLDA